MGRGTAQARAAENLRASHLTPSLVPTGTSSLKKHVHGPNANTLLHVV